MLGPLSIAEFAPLIGEPFSVDARDLPVQLDLVSAQALGAAPPGHREPFSLIFRGPAAPLLEQRIYPLRHATLGTQEIFIVPIGPDAHGPLYEAIFA